MDYLLKPVNYIELGDALKRIERKQVFTSNQSRIENLLYNLNSESDKFNKIALPTSEGLQFVKLNQIMYCVAEENYTNIFVLKNEKILVTKTLKYFEENLPNASFFRAHKSHIVNLNYIKLFNKAHNTVELEDGTILGVSMRRTDDFMNALKSK